MDAKVKEALEAIKKQVFYDEPLKGVSNSYIAYKKQFDIIENALNEQDKKLKEYLALLKTQKKQLTGLKTDFMID